MKINLILFTISTCHYSLINYIHHFLQCFFLHTKQKKMYNLFATLNKIINICRWHRINLFMLTLAIKTLTFNIFGKMFFAIWRDDLMFLCISCFLWKLCSGIKVMWESLFFLLSSHSLNLVADVYAKFSFIVSI